MKQLVLQLKNLLRSYMEYEDILLNKKCFRHSMNRIQSRDRNIGTYEINKTSLFCFYNKIYIQINGCDGLALSLKNRYLNNYQKTVILITIKRAFFQANCFNFFSPDRTAFLTVILNLKNAKNLKKIIEELMPIVWHANRW